MGDDEGGFVGGVIGGGAMAGKAGQVMEEAQDMGEDINFSYAPTSEGVTRAAGDKSQVVL